MHYVVHCLDHDGAVETRLANYDAHKAYLAAAPVKTVISGPLLADDEQTMIGSCFVIEADSLAEVEDFNPCEHCIGRHGLVGPEDAGRAASGPRRHPRRARGGTEHGCRA